LITPVEFEIKQQDLGIFAYPSFGTTLRGSLLIPILKPVGHQSTKFMVLYFLMAVIELTTSLGETSPLNIIEQAINLLRLVLHVAN